MANVTCIQPDNTGDSEYIAAGGITSAPVRSGLAGGIVGAGKTDPGPIRHAAIPARARCFQRTARRRVGCKRLARAWSDVCLRARIVRLQQTSAAARQLLLRREPNKQLDFLSF